jgi:hypothetical protein
MSSKQIYDHPKLLTETPLLDLTEATKKFPVRCSRSSIERWVRRGARGVQLETILVGNRRFTTEAAIERFLVGQQQTLPEQSRIEPRRNLSKKEIAEASKRFGLPEPVNKGIHINQK